MVSVSVLSEVQFRWSIFSLSPLQPFFFSFTTELANWNFQQGTYVHVFSEKGKFPGMQCLLGVHFLRGSSETAGEQTVQHLTKMCKATECVDVVGGSRSGNCSGNIVDNMDTFCVSCVFLYIHAFVEKRTMQHATQCTFDGATYRVYVASGRLPNNQGFFKGLFVTASVVGITS